MGDPVRALDFSAYQLQGSRGRDSSVTEDGVRLGSDAVHAIEPAGHASEAAELSMTLDGDELFLITVGIGHAMDAAL